MAGTSAGAKKGWATRGKGKGKGGAKAKGGEQLNAAQRRAWASFEKKRQTPKYQAALKEFMAQRRKFGAGPTLRGKD